VRFLITYLQINDMNNSYISVANKTVIYRYIKQTITCRCEKEDYSDSSVVANLCKQKFQQVVSLKGLAFNCIIQVNCKNIREKFYLLQL